MDIYKVWREIKTGEDSPENINKTEIMKAIHFESNSSLFSLKKSLKQQLIYTILFIISFSIAMIYYAGNMQLVLLIAIPNVCYIISFFIMWLKYKNLASGINHDINILENLRSNYKLVKDALNVQMVFFLLCLPIILMAAILFHDVKSGFTIMESLNVVDNLKSIFYSIILGLPFVYFSGEWMNKMAFGKYLDELQFNIKQLEKL